MMQKRKDIRNENAVYEGTIGKIWILSLLVAFLPFSGDHFYCLNEENSKKIMEYMQKNYKRLETDGKYILRLLQKHDKICNISQ